MFSLRSSTESSNNNPKVNENLYQENKCPVSAIAQTQIAKSSDTHTPPSISHVEVLTLFDLPSEILASIMYRLSRNDLLQLDQVSKIFGAHTDFFWKNISREQGLDLTFAISQEKSERRKYLFAKAVVETAFDLCSREGLSFRKILKIADRYNGLEVLFPRLYQLIESSLSHEEYSETVEDRRLTHLSSQEGLTGDLILQGLLENEAEAAFNNFKAAAKKNETAGLLAVLAPGGSVDDRFDIACAAAERGKYDALDLMLERYPELSSRLAEKSYPPVLVFEAKLLMLEHKYVEAEELLNQAVSGYGVHVPFDVLALNGFVKTCLGKDEEADELFSQAQLVSRYSKDLEILIEEHCKKIFEASSMEEGVMRSYTSPTNFLLLAANAKLKLEKWEEADELHSLAIKANALTSKWFHSDESEGPKWLLIEAAYVKVKLGRWEEAKNLYMEGSKHLDCITGEVGGHASFVEENLKKFIRQTVEFFN